MHTVLLTHHTILLCNIECSREHIVHTRNYNSVQESDCKILSGGSGGPGLCFSNEKQLFVCVRERVVYKNLHISLKGRKSIQG